MADTEGEQDEQVEMDDPQRPAPVEEAAEEDHRQRKPDVGRVQLVPERSLVAAGHLPGHLVPGPRLGHHTGARVDVDHDDLFVAVEVADLPAGLLGFRLRPGGERATLALGLDDVRVAVRDPGGLSLADLGARRAGADG